MILINRNVLFGNLYSGSQFIDIGNLIYSENLYLTNSSFDILTSVWLVHYYYHTISWCFEQSVRVLVNTTTCDYADWWGLYYPIQLWNKEIKGTGGGLRSVFTFWLFLMEDNLSYQELFSEWKNVFIAFSNLENTYNYIACANFNRVFQKNITRTRKYISCSFCVILMKYNLTQF